MKKLLMFCGISTAVLYIGTVILGGLIRPGYSHLHEAISELVADGAPNRSLLSSLFLFYNALLSLFGLGLFFKSNSQPRGRLLGIFGSLSLMLLAGVAGLLMELAFPQDPGGTPVTFAGTMHLVMAGCASLGTMLAVLLLGLWFRNMPELKSYVAYSLVSVGIGPPMTGTAPANLGPYTTMFTHGFDSAVITPATVIAGIYLLKRKPLGYILATPLLILCTLIGVAVISQTIAQALDAITFPIGVYIGMVGSWVVMGAFAVGLTISFFRHISETASISHIPSNTLQSL